MSATVLASEIHDEKRHVSVVSWKTPLIFGIFTVV